MAMAATASLVPVSSARAGVSRLPMPKPTTAATPPASSATAPSVSSKTTAGLLDQQHRRVGEVHYLVCHRADPFRRRADGDHVAARLLRVSYDGLGRIAHQDARLVAQSRALELLPRLRKRLLALVLVVALDLRFADELADARQMRHRQVHGDELDLGLRAIPVGVVDHAFHGVERVR